MNDLRLRGAVLLVITLLAGGEVHATPTGAQLARSCTRALAAGYTGFEAGICDWYVVPCPVCGAQPRPATACPPADVDHATLARLVVTALATRGEAADTPAPALVADILTAAYPCPADLTVPPGSR